MVGKKRSKVAKVRKASSSKKRKSQGSKKKISPGSVKKAKRQAKKQSTKLSKNIDTNDLTGKADLDSVLGAPPSPKLDKDLPEIPKPIKEKKEVFGRLFKKKEPKLEMPDVEAAKSEHLDKKKDKEKKGRKEKRELLPKKNIESRKILDEKKVHFFDNLLKHKETKEDKLEKRMEKDVKKLEKDEKDIKSLDRKYSEVMKEAKTSPEKLLESVPAVPSIPEPVVTPEEEDEVEGTLKSDVSTLEKDEGELKDLDKEFSDVMKETELPLNKNVPEAPELPDIKVEPRGGFFSKLFGKKSTLEKIDDTLQELSKNDVAEDFRTKLKNKKETKELSKDEPAPLPEDLEMKGLPSKKTPAKVARELKKAVAKASEAGKLPVSGKTKKSIEKEFEEEEVKEVKPEKEEKAEAKPEEKPYDRAVEQRIIRLEREQDALAHRESELEQTREEFQNEREHFEADREEFEEKLEEIKQTKRGGKDIRLLQLTIEKLKERERSQLTALRKLDEKLNQKKYDYETQVQKLTEWEERLTKKERELDERENVLLTMQTEIIKERRELDDREFAVYMKEELAQMPSRLVNKDFEAEQVRMKMDLTPRNIYLQNLVQQTRELLVNGHYTDAKVSYNRLVKQFQDADLGTEEKKRLHLLILELYNDIHVAEVKH